MKKGFLCGEELFSKKVPPHAPLQKTFLFAGGTSFEKERYTVVSFCKNLVLNRRKSF